MTSGSTQVLNYLQGLGDDAQFSRVSIMQKCPEVSKGAVSGFLARLKRDGAIELVRRTPAQNGHRAQEIYRKVNLGGVNTKATPSLGGKVGRRLSGTDRRQRIANLLMDLASEVERMHTSLADYSTAELLKELARRTTP